MRHGSLSPPAGRHGTTVSGAARVRESYLIHGNSSWRGHERAIVQSRLPYMLTRGILDLGVPNPRSPNCLGNGLHCGTSSDQPQVGVQFHKFRTMSGKCQSAGWRSGKTARSMRLSLRKIKLSFVDTKPSLGSTRHREDLLFSSLGMLALDFLTRRKNMQLPIIDVRAVEPCHPSCKLFIAPN
jgi:hypothetical protein